MYVYIYTCSYKIYLQQLYYSFHIQTRKNKCKSTVCGNNSSTAGTHIQSHFTHHLPDTETHCSSMPAHTYTVTFHTSSTWHWDTLFFNAGTHVHSYISHIIYLTLRHTVLQCRHTRTQSHFTHHLPDTETHCSSMPAHTYTVTFHTSSTWHWDTLFFNAGTHIHSYISHIIYLTLRHTVLQCRHTRTQSHFTHHLPDTETHCSQRHGTPCQ